MSGRRSDRPTGDTGSVLPLVLVFIVVLGLVLAATARYTGTNLRYTTVVRERSEATASAEAALRYAIQRVRSNAVTSCEDGPVTIAPTYDVAVDPVLDAADEIDITCDRLSGANPTMSGWAAVVTGVGVTDAGLPCPGTSCELLIEEHGDGAATGRIFLPSLRRDDFRIISSNDTLFAGNLFYDGSSDDCASVDRYTGMPLHDDDITMVSGSFVCWPQSWDQVVSEPPVRELPTNTPPPAGTDLGDCRVFEPGRYTSIDIATPADPTTPSHNYFKSGLYVFEDVDIDTGGDNTYILGGFPPDERFDTRLVSGQCRSAQAADGRDPGPSPAGVSSHGVTWYFTGSTKLTVRAHSTLELIPKLHDDGPHQRAVSIHVLGTDNGDAVAVDDAGGHNHVLIHGQIWAPYRVVDLRTFVPHDADPIDGTGQATSGVVAAQLFLDSVPGTVGTLGPDLTVADHELLLVATATVNRVTVEARAVVEHRPSADPGDRVAVRSIRIGD